MPKQTRIRWIIAALVAIGAVAYLWADAEAPTERRAELQLKRVQVGEVTTAADRQQIRFSGVVRSARRARLSFAIGGRILDRPVEVGQQVAKGALVARLDDRELRNAAATAEAALAELQARRAQVERDVSRVEQLVNAKAATDEELEQSRAGLDAINAGEKAAKTRVRESRRLLDEAALRAPFAGTITEVGFEPGEVAAAGQPVAMLSGDGDLEVEVEVPESIVGQLSIGDVVVVDSVRLRTDIDARIHSIGRTTAGPGRLFPVVATLAPSSGLMAGSTVELLLALGADQALSVPVEAVVNPGGRHPAVFRLRSVGGDSTVEKVDVEVGGLSDNRVMVTGDLEAGDRVVVGGQRGLLDGQAVEIMRGVMR